ncbi:hypothetical protein [Kitasatospora atroaurantiaca]|uniref:Uncharacterized protein n=1 Tax=Kitasatospora atroaurantiaca TaxID=285545 RepID=A0A561EVN1_9ACTN|nr:hypothetical protein [Kitasatospora atroaurantiaca]TWE19662.1 hypothetical protein FB465_4784 [Kitasatospora atroaurantiaca]
MIEYELIQQRNAELQRAALNDRLVREARRGADSRPGLLRRLAKGVRLNTARPARLSEC